MSQQQREQIKVAKERAVLVAVRLPRDPVDLEDRLKELQSLADTAGAEVVGMLTQKRHKPVGRTFLGKGKVEELGQLVVRSSILGKLNTEIIEVAVRKI